MILSEAHLCVKHSTEWTGFKIHFTETCDSEQPRLITDVETTTSTTHDVKLTQPVQARLTERGLQAQTHLVDEGYMETNLLVNSQKQGIDLVGPVPSHKSWQSLSEEGFDHTQLPQNADQFGVFEPK